MRYLKIHTTLLNITLTKVFTTIQGKDFVQYAQLMRSPPSTQTSKKYYTFT